MFAEWVGDRQAAISTLNWLHETYASEDHLYVTLERLNQSNGWVPSIIPYVAVFDTATDTEIDTGVGSVDGVKGIPLPVRNTGAIQYLAEFSHVMNLLLMGKEMAQTLGIRTTAVSFILLVTTSFIVSITVSYCGLLGFVGLVMPHLLRLILGPDHRVLVPACVLGGGAYMILCDVLARILPRQGELPTGVITALIGAPLFIYLLKRSKG